MYWTMHVECRYESIKLLMPKASSGNIITIRMSSTYSPAKMLMASKGYNSKGYFYIVRNFLI